MRFAPLAACAALLLVPTVATAQESLQVSFDTTPAGGGFAPKNIVAVWLEDSNGAFVKTIGRWAATRVSHLVAWNAASGYDVDAVSGATRPNHDNRLTVTWDMLDRNGSMVPNGTYTIRMELADGNSSNPDQNNQGTFTFDKNGTSSTQNVSGGGFLNVSIDYSATASATCDDGTIDPGETCDPISSCPTQCAPSTDACVTVSYIGSADACTAECLEQTVTTCTDGDGCCPSGCTASNDNDCTGGGGGGGAPVQGTSDIVGGCSAGGTGAPLFVLLLALLALAPRRSTAARRRR